MLIVTEGRAVPLNGRVQVRAWPLMGRRHTCGNEAACQMSFPTLTSLPASPHSAPLIAPSVSPTLLPSLLPIPYLFCPLLFILSTPFQYSAQRLPCTTHHYSFLGCLRLKFLLPSISLITPPPNYSVHPSLSNTPLVSYHPPDNSSHFLLFIFHSSIHLQLFLPPISSNTSHHAIPLHTSLAPSPTLDSQLDLPHTTLLKPSSKPHPHLFSASA